MSHRTFGPGFLADKLYGAEDPVPAGTFEQIQSRRKRRSPLGWLLPSFALLTLLSLGGYLYLRPSTRQPYAVKQLSSQAPGVLKDHVQAASDPSAATGPSKTAGSPLDAPLTQTKSAGNPVETSTSSESVPALANGLSSSTKRAVASPSQAVVTDANAKAAASATVLAIVPSKPKSRRPAAPAREFKAASPAVVVSSQNSEYGQSDEPTRNESSECQKATAPSLLAYTPYDQGLLAPAEELDSRLSLLKVKSPEANPLSVYPVGVNKNLFSHWKLTEVLVDFGPTALTQKVHFTERNFSPEQGKFSTLYTEPGIGLEAGITVRSQFSPCLGLLAGVRSRVFWQTVSGKVKTSQSSPVSYTSIDAFTVEAQPQLTEQGYTLKSTIWMPLVPELLLEFRPPNAIWGISAGAYLNAYPQTFLSYRGQGMPATPYKPGPTVEPVAQIWTQTSRTRITISVRRIQGTGLLPHPLTSSSDGLLTSATMSYRFGW